MKLAYPVLFALLNAPMVHASDIFINELHYDNVGTDVGETFEVAGPSGVNLDGWSVVFYNGNDGTVYRTTELSGLIPNQQDGFGTISESLPSNGIQNGSPDGLALVDNNNAVVQFLSYEGTLTAVGGPADGMTSIEISVSESSSTPEGFSLQLGGTGNTSDDFVWQEASTNTFGDINTNQVFGAGGPSVDSAPIVIATTPADNTGVIALDANIDISFSEAVNVSSNWFDISCSISGAKSATVSEGPQHYILNPDSNFVNNEVCTMTIIASEVNDVDTNDGPDFMEADVSFRFGTAVDSPVLINEVDADTSGSDTLEFIELFDGGVGNTPLDGLVVVLYNGSDNRSYNDAIDLDGHTTNAEGFFVIGNSAVSPAVDIVISNNGIQNGADAVALYAGNASDYKKDTDVSGISLIDAIVYDTSDGDDQDLLSVLTPDMPQVNENGANNKDNDANARVPDGGIALNTAAYLQQTPTPGASNVVVAEIFEIQGTGLTSVYRDSYVATKNNVVTAVDTDGFFMQTPVSRSDNNVETSDGLYVFTGSNPSVAVGDAVNVSGQIIEFFNFTEFSGDLVIEVISSGNALPPVITFDETTPSSNQPQAENELERFEGMIVSFEGVASAATDRFGDTAVVAGTERAFREPGLLYPGIAGLPVWDGNPEIFEINPDALGLSNESFFAGQTISATGPLGFSFGDYQVWPTILMKGPEPDLLTTVRAREEGEITVAALNMFRPSQIANVYSQRLIKISEFVRNVMDAPDILAVSEVEDIDVLQTIANQISADDASIQYRPYLVEGNDVGGIDVGFLVRAAIEVDAVTQFGKDVIFDFDGRILNDRPPLLLEARSVTNGNEFAIKVLALHNRSLGSVDSSERVRAKRLAQAQFVAGIVQELQTENPKVNLVVTGDFNAYQFTDGYVDVVGQIAGTSVESDNLLWEPSPVVVPMTNQVTSIAANQQYSFVFGGSAQVLDHALTSASLSTMVSGFEFARGNADSPANLVNDDSTALRSSDHDGLVLYITKDADNDSVADAFDVCPATNIPETAPSKGLKPNHFALLNGDLVFDSIGKAKGSYSITDTAGCSCEQIVEKQGLGKGLLKHGCSSGVMKEWMREVARP